MKKETPKIIKEIRKDFPLINNNSNYVYVDNAATTQKPKKVIDSIVNYYNNYNSNVHRGVHTLSEIATNEFEKTREKIADFINVSNQEIIFTYGTTHGINTLANGFGNKLNKNDEIVITQMEHHSNIVPWQQIAKKTGAKLKVIPINENYELDYKKAQEIITKNTKILSISHSSNVLGTINDIEYLGELAKSKNNNCFVFVDGAQEIANLNVDCKKLNCDAYSFSAHKIFGPTGVGALYIKQDLLDEIEPLMYGGSMIEDVSFENSSFAKGFQKMEAGTPAIANVIGFGAAIDYVNSLNRKEIIDYKQNLTKYFLEKAKELGDIITIYGPKNSKSRNPVFSFNLEGVHPNDLTQFLNEYNIAIRSGHHCAIPLFRELKLSGSARVSLTIYNTYEEVDKIIDSLNEINNIFNNN